MPGARVAAGEVVTLRTAEREDTGFLQRAHANPDIRRPLGWRVRSRTAMEPTAAEGFGHDELFVVCRDGGYAGAGQPDADDVTRLGAVAVTVDEHRGAELAFWLVPDARGEGAGTDAVSLAVDHRFDAHPQPAVHARTHPDDEAARGLLTSLGFSRDGRIRRAGFRDGDYHDVVRYSVLRSEW